MAVLAIAATAVIASIASAEVVTPEVIKPQVVTPHEVTAPAEDRSTPAEPPAPEASVEADAGPEVALEEAADADGPQPAAPGKAELPVGDHGGRQTFPGTDPETISEVNFKNALFLIYAVTGMLSPISQQVMIQESISVVNSSSILLGGEGGGAAAGKRTDDEPEKSEQ